MSLNQLGLGLLFSAKDLASGVMQKVRSGFNATKMSAEELQGAMSSARESFATGAKVFGVGIGALGTLGVITQQAVQFGHEIAKIRTVIDEASFSTEDLRKTTMGLAASYGLDAMQQAGALYETLSAGITDADAATRLVEVANEFAVGGTTSLAGAVDVLTSAVNTYADQGLTAERASDLMFTAIAAGKTTAEELSASLGEIAPTAHAAGVGFDELQAAIAALTVQGIKTPQAVTSLNAVLSNVMKPTADAEKEAKRLGIAFDATALKTKGLRGVLMQLVGNTKVNNDTFTNLFGSVEGVKGALTLTSGEGAKFNEIMGAMTNATGATGKAFDVMANTTKFQQDRFKALSQNALILIGEVLEPMIASVTRFANNAIEAFTKLPKPMRELLVRGAALAAVVVSLVGAFMAAKSAIVMAKLALAGMGAGLGPVIAGVAAVIAVVAAFKLAIDNNLGGIGDRFRGFVDAISLTWEALKQLFSDGGFSGKVREEFLKGGSAPINFAVRLWLAFNRVKEFLSQLGSGFSSVIATAGPSFEALGAAASRIGDAFSGLWETVDPANAGGAFDSFAAAGKTVGGVLARIVVAVVNVATVIGDFLGGAIELVGPSFLDLGSTVVDALGGIFTEIGNIAKELGLVDSAVDGTQGGWVSFGRTVGKVVSLIVDLVTGLVRTIGKLLGGVFNVLGGVLDILTGNFEKGINRILYGIVDIIAQLVLGIVGVVAKLSDAIFGTDMSSTVEGWKTSVEGVLKKGFNIYDEKQAAAAEGNPAAVPVGPTALTPAEAAQLSASTMPALASMPGQNASFDPGTASMIGKEVAAAMSRTPQTPAQIVIQVDGQTIATANAAASASDAARSFEPQMSSMY